MEELELRASDALDWVVRGIFIGGYLCAAVGLACALLVAVSFAFAFQFAAGLVVVGFGAPLLTVALLYGATLYQRVCEWIITVL